jgi:hypothetical protein
MISTVMGVLVKKITNYDPDTGNIRFIDEYGETRDRHISELKANGGIKEIIDACPKE